VGKINPRLSQGQTQDSSPRRQEGRFAQFPASCITHHTSRITGLRTKVCILQQWRRTFPSSHSVPVAWLGQGNRISHHRETRPCFTPCCANAFSPRLSIHNGDKFPGSLWVLGQTQLVGISRDSCQRGSRGQLQSLVPQQDKASGGECRNLNNTTWLLEFHVSELDQRCE
jgi:hypothetical protein